jgi:hypothetical protein
MRVISGVIPSSLAEFYTETAIKGASKNNGILPMSDKESNLAIPPVTLFAPEPPMIASTFSERNNIHMSETDVNAVYFSKENLDKVQQQIQSQVYSIGGHSISRQSDIDVKLVMRSHYLTYSQNNSENVSGQVAELNKMVVDFCVSRILVEIEAYRKYRQDILRFPAPIELPIHTNIYGSRTGELKGFF